MPQVRLAYCDRRWVGEALTRAAGNGLGGHGLPNLTCPAIGRAYRLSANAADALIVAPLNRPLAAVAAQDLDYVVVIAIVFRRGWGGV